MIRAVLLDADGVLQSSRRFPEMVASFVSPEQREAFTQELLEAERPCLSGQADFGKRLTAMLIEWKLENSYDALMSVYHDIELDHGVIEHVESIRNLGVMCCIASNQQASWASHMSAVLRYARRFDREFYSHSLGVAKPDKRYFLRILADLELPANEVLFIDDSMPNVVAAAEVGLRSVHFPSNSGGYAMRTILRQQGLQIR
jgi:putative hydrolase of the HAD superfamily